MGSGFSPESMRMALRGVTDHATRLTMPPSLGTAMQVHSGILRLRNRKVHQDGVEPAKGNDYYSNVHLLRLIAGTGLLKIAVTH